MIRTPVSEWESETSHAYRNGFQVKEDKGTRTPLAWGKVPRAVQDKDDWVLVTKPGQPVDMDGTCKNVMILPPDNVIEQSEKTKGAKKKKKPKRQTWAYTRELTDTKYNEIYGRPLPHNYGRVNTCPVSEKNFMKTFNARELAEPNGMSQVYESTVRALEVKEFTRMLSEEGNTEALENIGEQVQGMKGEPISHGTQTAGARAGVGIQCGESCTSPRVNSPCSRAQQTCNPFVTFGKPSKSRREEPSMFELLSWEDPEDEWALLKYKSVNTLDPRNYAHLNSKLIQTIPPA
mmetsp:Transcript_41077/g.66126  ORF Transcript_41077/g.66126 Transcript_41077/m.66126 type:complete len:291 (-) Transcript_41077:144-1016(-)